MSDVKTDLEVLQLHEEINRLEQVVARSGAASDAKTKELRALKRDLEKETAEREAAEKVLGFIHSVNDAKLSVPTWLTPKKSTKAHHATPTLLLSDLHLDEVVNPAEVEWYNNYDRKIAELRLRRTFEQAISMSRDYVAGVTFDGFVLALGGDILTGDIHAELQKTNETTMFDSIVHWVPQLAAGIEMLADEFGKVHVPCVVGNHDRNPMNRRTPAKQRAKDSLSWVIYQWLADRFRNDQRVTFQIAEGADTLYSIYSTRYMLTHGDQFRGGGGIAGIWSPIMKGAARKTARQAAFGKPFDWMVMGHWHQLVWGRGFIINGALKGYDEYAYVSNFDPEPPQQAFWITTPEHGITVNMPIYCEHPKEGWR